MAASPLPDLGLKVRLASITRPTSGAVSAVCVRLVRPTVCAHWPDLEGTVRAVEDACWSDAASPGELRALTKQVDREAASRRRAWSAEVAALTTLEAALHSTIHFGDTYGTVLCALDTFALPERAKLEGRELDNYQKMIGSLDAERPKRFFVAVSTALDLILERKDRPSIESAVEALRP